MNIKDLFKLLLISVAVLAVAGITQAATVNVRVSNGDDDAEEYVTGGGMNLSSSDLELIEDTSAQIVGIRFRYVQVPKGSDRKSVV